PLHSLVVVTVSRGSSSRISRLCVCPCLPPALVLLSFQLDTGVLPSAFPRSRSVVLLPSLLLRSLALAVSSWPSAAISWANATCTAVATPAVVSANATAVAPTTTAFRKRTVTLGLVAVALVCVALVCGNSVGSRDGWNEDGETLLHLSHYRLYLGCL
ncbi:unnamed protein product, partial [Ectocarpus sp. 13 AM-2016]